jgi:hypothetical protein
MFQDFFWNALIGSRHNLMQHSTGMDQPFVGCLACCFRPGSTGQTQKYGKQKCLFHFRFSFLFFEFKPGCASSSASAGSTPVADRRQGDCIGA